MIKKHNILFLFFMYPLLCLSENHLVKIVSITTNCDSVIYTIKAVENENDTLIIDSFFFEVDSIDNYTKIEVDCIYLLDLECFISIPYGLALDVKNIVHKEYICYTYNLVGIHIIDRCKREKAIKMLQKKGKLK